jgi:hypothetical protein
MRADNSGRVGIHSDLFGIIDVLCLSTAGILGVQSCGSDYAEHMRKIKEEGREMALYWMGAGGLLEIWAWRKIKMVRGGKAMRWEPRIHRFTVEELMQ